MSRELSSRMFICVTFTWEKHGNCQTVAFLFEKEEEIISTNLVCGRYTGSVGAQSSLRLPHRRNLEVRVGLRCCREKNYSIPIKAQVEWISTSVIRTL